MMAHVISATPTFTDGMIAGNLDLSQVAMTTTVMLTPLVTDANSLVTIVI